MYREAEQFLNEWKTSAIRKPLIIRGARQVGKTWLMKHFGETKYEKCAYINLDSNERMKQLFSENLDIKRIITGLEIEADITIDSNNTLIILDEIQEVPKALTSLKYFCENAPEYHIVSAGSLLGVALHPGTSFPVGKVSFLDLYPMNFMEFIDAVGQKRFANLIKQKDWEMIKTFSNKYIELLKQYYFVGGMPEVVSFFRQQHSFKEIREIQNRILFSFEQDFSKHAPNETVPKIRMLWNSIPSQLSKENRKFVYGLIRKGARAREYEMAIAWMIDCGLIHKVTRITKPNIPIKAYEDYKSFKLFILDIGLLGAMTSIDEKTLLKGSQIFTEFKGALTEQYVLQQLKANPSMPIHYWSHDRGIAEVDFVIQDEGMIIPIEAKAKTNLQAKSLKSYRIKYTPPISVRTSLSSYCEDNGLFNIPLYSICNLKDIIQD